MRTVLGGSEPISVRDLVRYTAHTDARETVVDFTTGAEIRINIDGDPDPDYDGVKEPFYIEHGEELYDAVNRKEAIMILSNIRKGKKNPELPDDSKPKRSKKAVSGMKKKPSPGTSVRGMR